MRRWGSVAALALVMASGGGATIAQDATPTKVPPPGDTQPAAPAVEKAPPASAPTPETKAPAKAARDGRPGQTKTKAAGKAAKDGAEAGSPFAQCDELQNDNGLRIIVMVPSARDVRLSISDRSGKVIEKDLFTPSRDATVAYARVLWGTRNTPTERLQKGAFLIKRQQKDRFMEGALLADGGDGSFLIHNAYLGKPDPDARRWTMRLGAERTLSCRVGNG